MTSKNINKPSSNGRFGKFGGKFVPETLMSSLKEIEEAFEKYSKDESFWEELTTLQNDFIGRPTPLYYAKNLSEKLNQRIWIKREDLAHTGAHKINNAIGQALLAKRIGKKRIIAETGAGQHGVATATVCALFNLPCTIYMGEIDYERQMPNVFRMKLLGAKVRKVKSGSKTLKDAMNEALRDWVTNVKNTFYIIGSVAGPHPYPEMVRDFQSIIGLEAKDQIKKAEGRLPNLLIACVGGGSNAMGLFYPFLNDKNVKMIGVEAAGEGLNKKHAASIAKGQLGVLHGSKSYILQNKDGQIIEPHSISAGLDYPGIGPEHAWLKDVKRVKYVSVTDNEALGAFKLCTKIEGIIPALEPSHALAYLIKEAPRMPKKNIVIMNMCGRGDKDIFTVAKKLKINI